MSYNTITIHGRADYNYLIASSDVFSEDQIQVLSSQSVHTPNWNDKMFLRATFENSLSASNFEAEGELEGYYVQKEVGLNGVLCPVAETDSETRIVNDYNIASTKNYRYWIFPKFKNPDGVNIFGSPIITEDIHFELDGWSLIGLKRDENGAYIIDTNNIWNFNLNVESPSYEPQFSKTVHNGFGKYPKMTSTKSNHLKMSFSALLGDISCSSGEDYYGDDIDKIKLWQDFCASDNPKLLRNSKGHVLIGNIETTSYKIDDTMCQAPTTISFNFTELESTDRVMIYGLEG